MHFLDCRLTSLKQMKKKQKNCLLNGKMVLTAVMTVKIQIMKKIQRLKIIQWMKQTGIR